MANQTYARRAVTRHDIDWVIGALVEMRRQRPALSDYPVHWTGSAQLQEIRAAIIDELIAYLEDRPLNG